MNSQFFPDEPKTNTLFEIEKINKGIELLHQWLQDEAGNSPSAEFYAREVPLLQEDLRLALANLRHYVSKSAPIP